MSIDISIRTSHWVIITAKPSHNSRVVESLEWRNMLFDHRTKWDWYFKYRAALLQVKYPRYIIDFRWGNTTMSTKSEIDLLKNKITAKKAKITTWRNKLKQHALFMDKFKREYHKLFPIEEDPDYCRLLADQLLAEQKIADKEYDLANLISEYEILRHEKS